MPDRTYADYVRARDAFRAHGGILPGEGAPYDPNAPPPSWLAALMDEIGDEDIASSMGTVTYKDRLPPMEKR